jgi:hypothetical protein
VPIVELEVGFRGLADGVEVTFEGFDNGWVELGSGVIPEFGECVLVAPRILVTPFGGHRVVGVADRDDASAERDGLATETVRISGAVPAFMR